MAQKQQIHRSQQMEKLYGSPLNRHRMVTLAQVELLCELSLSTRDRIRFELKDHRSKERILRQSSFVLDQARELLRSISLLDTNLDPDLGLEKTTEKGS